MQLSRFKASFCFLIILFISCNGLKSAEEEGFRSVSYEWTDQSRENRVVPVKIYYPGSDEGKPWPMIIFSHGLGGSRDGYAYLGQYWAQQGFVSVHLQHVGSDDAVWKDVPVRQRMRAMKESVADPRNAANRPRDVSFVIDKMLELSASDPLFKGAIHPGQIGMAGHSFGAWTTLMVSGMAVIGPSGQEQFAADPRIKAAIAMSPPGPKSLEAADRVYAKIMIPIFIMTGTEDTSPINDTKPEERIIPFQKIPARPEFLLVFDKGDHMVFSGRMRAAAKEADAPMQEMIKKSSLAFWKAFLLGDTHSRQWLEDGGMQKDLASLGTLEVKK